MGCRVETILLVAVLLVACAPESGTIMVKRYRLVLPGEEKR